MASQDLLSGSLQVIAELGKLQKTAAQSLQPEIEDLITRFEIWSRGNGVLRTDGEALDWRLRKSKSLHTALLKSLNDLLFKLRACMSDVIKPDQSAPDAGFQDDTKTLEDLQAADVGDEVFDTELGDSDSNDIPDSFYLLAAAQQNITALNKFAALIEEAVYLNFHPNALARVRVDEVKSLEDEASGIVCRFPRLRQPHLRWLLVRLAQANNQRRRYLLYRERVYNKTAVQIPWGVQAQAFEAWPDDAELKAIEAAKASHDLSSVEKIKDFLKKFIKRRPQPEHELEPQASAWSLTANVDERTCAVRPLEEISKGQEVFQCPYCREDQKINSQYAWKKHVFVDLRAYMCTMPACRIAIFQSSYALMHHHAEHAAICSECDEGPLSSEEQTLHEQKHKVSHWYDCDLLSAADCAFCDWSTNMDKGVDAMVTRERYRRHMASHCEQLALLVIDHDVVPGEQDDFDSERDDEFEQEREQQEAGMLKPDPFEQHCAPESTIVTTSGNQTVKSPDGNTVVVASGIVAAQGSRVTDLIENSINPHQPVIDYVSRPALMEKLQDRLRPESASRDVSSKIVIVSGRAGSGKTQLVSQYVKDHTSNYKQAFWIQAGSLATLDQDLVQVWHSLYRNSSTDAEEEEDEGDEDEDEDEDEEEKGKEEEEEKLSADDAIQGVKAWFQERQGQKWLFVFDNAGDKYFWGDGTWVALHTLVPDAHCVDVIITTRGQITSPMTSLEKIKVDEMIIAEAEEQLLRSSKMKQTFDTKRWASQLVAALGSFPLTLAIAGTYFAARPWLSIEDSVPELGPMVDSMIDTSHQRIESMTAVWEVSYAAVIQQCPAAQGLLRLLAFCGPNVSAELFSPLLGHASKSATIWSLEAEAKYEGDEVTTTVLGDAFGLLLRCSLLTWESDMKTWVMHRLIRNWIFDRMDHDEQASCGRQAALYIQELVKLCADDTSVKTCLVPHVMASFARMQEWYRSDNKMNEKALYSLRDSAELLADTGHVSQEIMVRRFVYSASLKLSDSDNDCLILDGCSLARAYTEQRCFGAAEQMFAEVIDMQNVAREADCPHTSPIVHALALLFIEQGQFAKAGDLLTRIAEAPTKALGQEHLSTLTSMEILWSVHVLSQRQNEANRLFSRIVELRRRLRADISRDLWPSTNTVIAEHLKQKRFEEAEAVLIRVLGAEFKSAETKSVGMLRAWYKLTTAYDTLKRFNRAHHLMARLVDLEPSVQRTIHIERLSELQKQGLPSKFEGLYRLAISLYGQGNLKEAKDVMIVCAEARGYAFGPFHRDTLAAETYLDIIQSRLGVDRLVDERQIIDLT